MLSFKSFILSEDSDHRGEHLAPMNTPDMAPLYKMDMIYPEDIYSSDAARIYGDMGGDSNDKISIRIIQSYRNKPNGKIKIYRAVPKILSNSEMLSKLETIKYNYMRRNIIPKTYVGDKKKFVEWINDEIAQFKDKPDSDKLIISPGDWVTINRQYAVTHGLSALKGNYRILTKIVSAKHVFTDANSIHEFGYDPN